MRGTGVAIYDYAVELERIGLPAPHFFCIGDPKQADSISKFKSRWGNTQVTRLPGWPSVPDEVDSLVHKMNLTHIYMQKHGRRDNCFSRTAVTLVHAVFDATQPHGDVYAKISEYVPGHAPVVPYMVKSFPHSGRDLRQTLGIPSNATVFGRYGGDDTFNIRYVLTIVEKLLADPNAMHIYFLFANTAPFVKSSRAIFLSPLQHDPEKATFVLTCDAMLHARSDVETFGLAIAEFAMLGRVIFTPYIRTLSSHNKNRAISPVHVRELGTRARYYTKKTLYNLLVGFDRSAKMEVDWHGYHRYYPAVVVRQFQRIFLRNSDF